MQDRRSDREHALSFARAFVMGAACVLGVLVVQAITGAGGDTAQMVLLSLVVVLAALACVARALHQDLDRPAWILLGVGLLALGSLGVVYVLDEGAALTFPSDLPAGLIGYPLTLAAWALL